MSRALALLFVGAVTVAACDLAFVAPLPPDAPPDLLVWIDVDARAGADVRLSASFFPGTHPDGALREVVRDTFAVLDTALTPVGRIEPGGLRYHAEWSRSALASEPAVVALTSPVVDGGDAIVGLPVGYTMARGSTDTIPVDRGAEARLSITAPPNVDGIDLTAMSWHLEATSGARHYRVDAHGPPPDTIDLPTSWLPADFDGDLDVRVRSNQDYRPAEAGMNLSVTIRTDLAWTVRVQSPDTSNASRGAP